MGSKFSQRPLSRQEGTRRPDTNRPAPSVDRLRSLGEIRTAPWLHHFRCDVVTTDRYRHQREPFAAASKGNRLGVCPSLPCQSRYGYFHRYSREKAAGSGRKASLLSEDKNQKRLTPSGLHHDEEPLHRQSGHAEHRDGGLAQRSYDRAGSG